MKRASVIGVVLVVTLAAALVVGCDSAPSTTSATSTVDAGADTTQATSQNGTEGASLPEAMPGAYTELTPEQAKLLMDTTPDLVVVDVSPSYAQGHLPGAVNYYGGDGTLVDALPTLDKSVPYLVYCHSESASRAGAQAFVDAGFSMVYRLLGEYAAWVDAGYPVEQ